jgi:isoleucyl-tRNA synthetase
MLLHNLSFPYFSTSSCTIDLDFLCDKMRYVFIQVMPYSTGCTTALSNFEAGQNYRDVSDPAVIVSFPVDNDPDNASFVAWTTTPWTLPSNLALCVNPEFVYLKVKDPATGKVYIVGKDRLSQIPGAVPKKKKSKKSDAVEPAGFEIMEEILGSELVGKTYTPLFSYFGDMKDCGAFKVCGDSYVTADSGTGIVHQAPAFGEDDYRVCLAHGVIKKGGAVPCPVDHDGCFTSTVPDFQGKHVKEADKEIIAAVKGMDRLVDSSSIVHSYPFCWRSDTPLIYKTVPSWFVKVEDIKPQLLENNTKTNWVPTYVKEKRFHNWLEGARDWAISRTRFWGTPIPIWMSDDGEEIVVIGSKQELEDLTGEKVDDLHRHFIDHLTIPSRQGKGTLKRVEDVFDCWFESGSMPYAQAHYPFENKDKFEQNFPGDFVAEGLDQTRGWFYTMMVLSTALFDKPAFKNLVCNGLVLAADGKKMSKRLKNYPDPMEVVHKYGADALRLYLIDSPVVRAETLKFQEQGVLGVVREVFLPWYNAYRFAAQNILRWEMETGESLDPEIVLQQPQTNILDRWISAAVRSLIRVMRAEMEGYRLYTVVPYLVKFIDNLTNIYVRYNRKRLKGRNGRDDTAMALATLHHVLMILCKAMAPFTPFFTENMYQNLKKPLKNQPESLHWCDFPVAEEEKEGDKHIQESVSRMQSVIDIVRQLRTKHNRSVKTPLKEITIVHVDESFLQDISGELQEYVAEESNVQNIIVCNDPLKYATLKAVPDWRILGKKLGKKMGQMAKSLQELPHDQLVALKDGKSIIVEGEDISPDEVKILTEFAMPEGFTEEELDAAGDGEVLVLVDLRIDSNMLEAKTAREIINRVQRLRKSSGVKVQDSIEVFVDIKTTSKREEFMDIISNQEKTIVEAVGVSIKHYEGPPTHVPESNIFTESHVLELGEKEGQSVELDVIILRLSEASV